MSFLLFEYLETLWFFKSLPSALTLLYDYLEMFFSENDLLDLVLGSVII